MLSKYAGLYYCLLLCHSYIFSSARCDNMPGSHAQDNKPTPITEN